MRVRSARVIGMLCCVIALAACGGDDDAGASGSGAGTGGAAGMAGTGGAGGEAGVGGAGTGGTGGAAGTGGAGGVAGEEDSGMAEPDAGLDAAMMVECDPGQQDNDGNGVCEDDCSQLSCVFGTCDDATGTAVCACQELYAGALCDELVPPMDGLVLWLDSSKAETLTLETLGGVSRWQNVLDDTEAFEQTGATARPRRLATGLNGKPTVAFDGTNDFLAMVGFDGIKDASAFEVYVFGDFVANATDTSGVVLAAVNGEAGTTGAGLHGLLLEVNPSANGLRLNHRMPFAASGGLNVTSMSNLTLDVASTLRALISDLPNDGSINITQDGTFRGAVEGSVVAFDRNLDLTMGRLSATQAERFVHGNISEVLVYAKRNSAATAAQVNTYLHTHWDPIQ